jgi:hypothetical protein
MPEARDHGRLRRLVNQSAGLVMAQFDFFVRLKKSINGSMILTEIGPCCRSAQRRDGALPDSRTAQKVGEPAAHEVVD